MRIQGWVSMEIDAVFSGGGIKGLALIGALEVLEKGDLRLNGWPAQASVPFLQGCWLQGIQAAK